MRQFDLEEGWATLDCFRVNAQYTDKNFLDKAQRLELTRASVEARLRRPDEHIVDAQQSLLSHLFSIGDSLASSKLNYYTGATIRQPTLFGTHWVPCVLVYTERQRRVQGVSCARRKSAVESSATRVHRAADAAAIRRTHSSTVRRMPSRRSSARSSVAAIEAAQRRGAEDAPVRGRERVASADSNGRSASSQRLGLRPRRRESAVAAPVSAPIRRCVLQDDGSSSLVPPARVAGRACGARGRFIAGGAERRAASCRRRRNGSTRAARTSVRGFQQNELGPLVYLLDRREDTYAQGAGTAACDSTACVRDEAGRTSLSHCPGRRQLVVRLQRRAPDPRSVLPRAVRVRAVPRWRAGVDEQVGTHNSTPASCRTRRAWGSESSRRSVPIQLNAGYNPYGWQRPGPAYFASPIDDHDDESAVSFV